MTPKVGSKSVVGFRCKVALAPIRPGLKFAWGCRRFERGSQADQNITLDNKVSAKLQGWALSRLLIPFWVSLEWLGLG